MHLPQKLHKQRKIETKNRQRHDDRLQKHHDDQSGPSTHSNRDHHPVLDTEETLSRKALIRRYRLENYQSAVLNSKRLYPEIKQTVTWDSSCDEKGVSGEFDDLWQHTSEIVGTTKEELPRNFSASWRIHTATFHFVDTNTQEHFEMSLAKFPRQDADKIWQVRLSSWKDSDLRQEKANLILAPGNASSYLNFAEAYAKFRHFAKGIITKKQRYKIGKRGIVYADQIADSSITSDYIIEMAGERIARLEKHNMICEAYESNHATCQCR